MKPTSVLRFFLLTYAFSAPFWLLAFRIRAAGLPDGLPVTDIGAVLAPAGAALALVHGEGGWQAARALLARALDARRIVRLRWLLVAVLLPIALCVAALVAMLGLDIDVPHAWILPANVSFVFTFFLLGAAAEEYGYTVYATDRLQQRFGAAATAVVIGVPWALWHLPSMIQLGQSPVLIAWGLAATVALRVLSIWIYNNSGRSAFAVILSHAVFNTTRSGFPGGRSAFEAADGAVAYSIIIAAATIVVAGWGAQTLKGRHARSSASGGQA